MSWHYLQAQGEESSEPICSDGDPLPPLKSKTTHAEFCCNGKLTDSYLASLSGTMSGHSTENPGEEGSMSYLEGSHAKTSVPPEKEKASPGNDPASGVKWHALSVKFDPDTSGWRTHHCLFPEDLDWSSLTLPKWGSMHDGELWERITSPPLTSATDVGFWPTPTKSDSQQRRKTENWVGYDLVSRVTEVEEMEGRKQPKGGGQLNPNWVELLMGWPRGWTSMSHLDLTNFNKWLMSWNGSKTSYRQTLPELQQDDGQKEIRKEAGGLSDLSTEEILLSFVREYEEGTNQVGLALQGKEVSEEQMRVLWYYGETTSSPYRRELQERCGGELSDFMCLVSQVYSSYGKEAWQKGTWEFAADRVARGVKNRVDRLKAIGNGQVPAVVALAWEILSNDLI